MPEITERIGGSTGIQSPDGLTESRPGLLSTGYPALHQHSLWDWLPFYSGKYQAGHCHMALKPPPFLTRSFTKFFFPGQWRKIEKKHMGEIDDPYIRDVLAIDVPETVMSTHFGSFAQAVPSACVLNLST